MDHNIFSAVGVFVGEQSINSYEGLVRYAARCSRCGVLKPVYTFNCEKEVIIPRCKTCRSKSVLLHFVCVTYALDLDLLSTVRDFKHVI